MPAMCSLFILSVVIGSISAYVDQCPLSINCNEKYPYYQTKHLRCLSNYDCPENYFCCTDCSFRHSVCKKSIRTNVEIEEPEIYTEKYCPKQRKKCSQPLSLQKTLHLACDADSKCPHGYFCCKDNCYIHRVCKKMIPSSILNNEANHLYPDHFCPKDENICERPLPFEDTKDFQCTQEKSCLKGYVCCKDSCYTHRICKKPVEEDPSCPKDGKICEVPLPINETIKYECGLTTKVCLKDYICCKDSCYQHKVCKSPRPEKERKFPGDELVCPPNIRKDRCPNPTYKSYDNCSKDSDCFSGYKCCEDICLEKRVCKLPVDNIIESKDNTKELEKENQHPFCPKIELKCTKSYSLRIASKIRCSSDTECKLDEACCHDKCISYFKICKKIQYTPKETVGQLARPAESGKETEAPTKTDKATDIYKETKESTQKTSNDTAREESTTKGYVNQKEYSETTLNLSLTSTENTTPKPLNTSDSTSTTFESTDDNACPKLERNCSVSYEEIVGSTICNSNNVCRENQLCCRDECITFLSTCRDIPNWSRNCPNFDETCSVKNSAGKKICLRDEDCPLGLTCCQTCLPRLKVCFKSDEDESTILLNNTSVLTLPSTLPLDPTTQSQDSTSMVTPTRDETTSANTLKLTTENALVDTTETASINDSSIILIDDSEKSEGNSSLAHETTVVTETIFSNDSSIILIDDSEEIEDGSTPKKVEITTVDLDEDSELEEASGSGSGDYYLTEGSGSESTKDTYFTNTFQSTIEYSTDTATTVVYNEITGDTSDVSGEIASTMSIIEEESTKTSNIDEKSANTFTTEKSTPDKIDRFATLSFENNGRTVH